jgi:hypothetical protein
VIRATIPRRSLTPRQLSRVLHSLAKRADLFNMAETDVVASFKSFARDHLLTQMRAAPGGALDKQAAYAAVRAADTQAHGWPADLDEVEAGPAQTSRWLNRLHWAVVDLVQSGILEKSAGSDQLRPTALGRSLLALQPTFRDSDQMRQLLTILAGTTTDAPANAQAHEVLADFRARFPPDRLADMDLKAYAIGGGDQDNFSWWLERGLERYGRFSPGSSRGHIIYQQKDGSYYLAKELQGLSPAAAMQKVAGWHAQLVATAAGPKPELADTQEIVLSKRSRALKILYSYFPDRFIPINSMAHLGRLLTAFGVPAPELPAGPVARNRLLFRLYEEVAAPHGLTPLDFARVLYANFNPAGIKLDPERLRGAIRLFQLVYGPTCDASSFVTAERDYKQAIMVRWQAAAQPDDLARALRDGTEVAKAAELSAALILPPSNFLNYRYRPAISNLTERPAARIFVEAVANLLASAESDDTTPDITGFNAAMVPLYERLDVGPRIPVSRTLPTLILMLTFPDRELVIRSDAIGRAVQALAKRPAFDEQAPLTTEAYRYLREFADAVRTSIAELAPADMTDVQGFLWSIFSQSDLWFGGVTYDQGSDRADMLPAFRQAGIYGVGYGDQEPLRSLVADAPQLSTEDRKQRAQQIAANATDRAEATSLTNFIELAARPGSTVIAKSTYADKGGSAIRIRASAVTKPGTGFDAKFGHTVDVEWSSDVDLRLRLKAFGKVSGTLAPIKLADALDILGAEAILGTESDKAPREPLSPTVEPPTAPPPIAIIETPALPKNLILYGPPGTGKTHRLLQVLAPQFGDRFEMITFHPGYAYEEFVEGLRPVSDVAGGPIRYDVVPGVFRRACKRAAAQPEAPFLFAIDEINRANLATVLGELITIIEEDKRGGKTVVTLSYSKESFSVPANLWIVGTMNTADRSIALMDVALRRRFAFQELAVDYEALRTDYADCQDSELATVDLVAILRTINERLRILLDREHQIGHAWLFGVRDLSDLRTRFAGRIVPLLAEYFFDDWSRICLVLGEDPRKAAPTDFVAKAVAGQSEQHRLFGRTVREGADPVLYDLWPSDTWSVEQFIKVAASPVSDLNDAGGPSDVS